MRTNITGRLLVIIFLLLGLGLSDIQLIHGRRYRKMSENNCVRLIPQEGSRGRILDREGRVIVDSSLSYNLMVLSSQNRGLDNTLPEVSRILGISPKELKDNYRRNLVGSFMPTVVAANIGARKAIALDEIRQDIENIAIQTAPLRHYPYRELAAHVIGYLNEIDRWRLTRLADYGYKTKDIVGFGGVEQRYDYYLRQEEGGLSVEVDHRGRSVGVLGFRSPQDGKDIQLTIDLRIQKIVEEVFGQRKGAAVIMDPYSGEVLAMFSSPGFAPESFVKKNPGITRLFRDSDAPMLNRAISGVYPAGSMFKLVVASAALETKKISPYTTFTCTGSTYIGRKEFSCWDTHGEQNLVPAIAHSCNVFFYRTGLATGAQAIYDYALRFGFARPSGIDLPYESSGFVPSPLWKKVSQLKGWFEGDTANFAIGQGDLLVTPLQITRMMAVFANKGMLVSPYIVKAVAEKDISSLRRKSVPLGLKDSTINYIRQGLRGVVNDSRGTAQALATLSIAVAGKTGTAQVTGRQPHGWFAGFFPYEKPRFVICVFLEHGGSGYASSIVGKHIIERMLKEKVL